MNIKSNKGSITIFVLVGLLFMTGFLIISFGSNVNKSKVAKEQFNIMSGIYSHNDGDAKAYDRAYTALRKKKAQTLTSKVENSNTLNLTKTFSNTKISDYKIYGNSVQDTTTYGTPSPTNPVEIQSVGDRTKNLFNINNLESSDNVVNNNNGTISVTPSQWSSGVAALGNNKLRDYAPELKVGETYILSASSTGTSKYIYLDITGDVWMYGSTKTITENDLNSIVYWYANGTDISFTATISEIQIEKGTIKTDYEPYGYKIPVKVTGKNIFNPNSDTRFTLQEDGSYLSNTNITTTTTIIGNLKGTYTISLKVKCPIEKNYRITAYYTDGTYTDSWKQSTGEYIDISLTTNGKDIEKIIWNYGASSNQVQFKDFQIERGTEATDYEPYVEPQTFNIYLDEPLRKIGNYEDYIDFSTGKVVRKIYRVLFDGSNDETWSTWGVNNKTEGITGFYAYYNSSNLPEGSKQTMEIYCNIAPYKSVWGGSQFGCGNNTGSRGYVMLALNNNDLADISTSENAVISLRTLLSTVGVEYNYILETPDDTEKIDLPELKTYEDYTNIEVLTDVVPSKIEVEYEGYTFE